PDDQLLNLNLWPGDRIFLRWLDQDAFFSAKFVYDAGELTNHQVVFYTREGVRTASATHTEGPTPSLDRQPPGYHVEDDTYCWLCGGPVVKRHCKIVCPSCGFTRDCSDP